MATNISAEEIESTKSFLKVVNEVRRRNNANAVDLSFQTAVKFMMARKFDVDRALSLYEQHELVRSRENLSEIDLNKIELRKELETAKFMVLPSRDKDGSKIVIFSVSRHTPLERRHEITLQGMVHQLDAAMEDLQTQRCGLIFVYNMIGSKYSNFDYELSQKILSLLKGAYPARLKKVLIVMAPLWFKAPFKILRLFVREKLRDRVHMVNLSQLHLHVPADSLPSELGGSLEFDYSRWLEDCAKLVTECPREGGLSDLAFKNSGNLTSRGNILSTCTSNQSLTAPGPGSSDDETSSASSVNEAATVVNSTCDTLTATLNRKKPEKIIMPNIHPVENGGSTSSTNRTNPPPIEEDKRPVLHSNSDPSMTLEEFITHMKNKGKKGLFEEYNEIKSLPLEGTFEHSRMPNNLGKNRYTDVLCFDHSRVKLLDPESDYINANFCDGYMQKRAFISTQGPLPRTFGDFWQMVWQESVVVIVMTTRTCERNRIKCGQYWPLDEGSKMNIDKKYEVTNDKLEAFADYNISQLTLVNLKDKCSRKICHMAFLSWPDYGVPQSAVAMLEFREKVRQQQKILTESLGNWNGHPNGPPIIVHCSAGIGRTGTFMTLDISLMRLEDTGKIDIRRTVEKIRTQRAHSIQMPDQYVFCYLALLEFALTRGLLQDADLSGFDDSESDIEEE